MAPQNMDEVITALEADVERARGACDRMGYFAAVLRRVNTEVRACMQAGRYEDNARMERFAVTFAGRFLGARADYPIGPRCTSPWRAVMKAADDRDFVILQHLSAGAVAHIKLDLGVAAATLEAALPGFERDFREVNGLLGSIGPSVYREIGEVSGAVALLNDVAGPFEGPLMRLGTIASRHDAWDFAMELAAASTKKRAELIYAREQEAVASIASVFEPSALVRPILAQVRKHESYDVAAIIDALDVPGPFVA